MYKNRSKLAVACSTLSAFVLALICFGCARITFLLSNDSPTSLFDIQIAECGLENDSIFRLYRGDGGSTTAYWYRVTLQQGSFAKEHLIFDSYATPMVTGIRCEKDLKILTNGLPIILSTSTIEKELIAKPIIMVHGEQKTASPSDPLIDMAFRIVVVSMVIIGIVLLSLPIWYFVFRRAHAQA